MIKKVGADQSKWYYPALVVASLCLLIPAFYNHYPLVNPDTGTYLASGFIPETPFDRPITYGLLIRLFSLNGLLLWCVVFAQAYIVSWLLFKIFKNIAAGSPYILKGLLTILVLSTCSSLSWIVSQVQPDVFTPIAFLCIILLLLNSESKRDNILLYTLFFTAVAVHLSHPALFIATLLCMIVFKRIFTTRNNYRQINIRIAILIILSAASIALMGSALAKSRHVFFTGSLLEKGILKRYLDDKCAVSNYKLCAYKDSLPDKADYFWWDPGSPLYKIGGWKGTKGGFDSIIHGVCADPVYLELFAAAAARQTVTQAITFNIGDGNTSFPPGSNVYLKMAGYLPGQLSSFEASRQNNAHLSGLLVFPNILFTCVIILSLAGFLFILFWRRSISPELKIVFIVCCTGILLNCIDCSVFGIVNGRYGCKMIWLLPFCNLLFLLRPKLHI